MDQFFGVAVPLVGANVFKARGGSVAQEWLRAKKRGGYKLSQALETLCGECRLGVKKLRALRWLHRVLLWFDVNVGSLALFVLGELMFVPL